MIDHICNSVIADIRDRSKILTSILDFQPDFVFHLAAQPLVRRSYEIPSETFEVNAIGTANVLDGVRLLNKKCTVILVTTDKVYQNNEWVYPYREDDRLGGYDPYSASKACTELVINSYRSSFFNLKQYNKHLKAIAVGRAGNVIGGGDWSSDRLIPDIVRAFEAQCPVIVRNPYSVRPWQHVIEPVVAYLMLGCKLNEQPKEHGEAYNFGPYAADAMSVVDMLNLSIKSWGSGTFILDEQSDRPHEAGLLKLDISKAINVLGWKPKLTAEQAVKLTMEWYGEFFRNPTGLDKYTEYQIMNYLNA
ncbi:MAG: CDP-glucose 4,6-dehydratase [Pedobacter sp.]|nr:MAG: CDP-glucose 4,6-dehydratase [Pedobacter sp.]